MFRLKSGSTSDATNKGWGVGGGGDGGVGGRSDGARKRSRAGRGEALSFGI